MTFCCAQDNPGSKANPVTMRSRNPGSRIKDVAKVLLCRVASRSTDYIVYQIGLEFYARKCLAVLASKFLWAARDASV
jgi:hypothetical protein